MKGARGVLINITGGQDLTLFEVDEAANRIRSEVDPDANIIVGSTFDDALDGSMRVSVFATGIEAEAGRAASPATVMPFVPREADKAPAPAPQLEPTPAPTPEPVPAPAPAQAEVVTLETPAEAEAAELLTLDMEDALEDDAASLSHSGMPDSPVPDVGEEAPFIAPRAMEAEPEETIELPQERPAVRPDPFAEAAVTNGARESEPRQTRGPSLFERMIGKSSRDDAPREAEARQEPVMKEPVVESRPAASAEPVEEAIVEAVAEPAAEPMAAPMAEPMAQPVAEAVTEPVSQPVAEVAPLPKPEPAPAPAPVATAKADGEQSAPLTLQSVAGDARPKPGAVEDQIDIPAFLRRQAN